MDWKTTAKRKREALLSAIPQEWRIDTRSLPTENANTNVTQLIRDHLSIEEVTITESQPHVLLSAIADGLYTSTETLRAFSHRASIAHQLTNCISEINFESATTRARELDTYYRSHKQTKGPLHGLPISVTDRFAVAGLESAAGFVSWLGTKKQVSDEGILVQTLQRLGAIIFCKTTVPMSTMLGETVNNITGKTSNPYNLLLSAGGACGGEGALLALHGSPLGLATDIAGSSRIPCAFNGLYGLKPSECRLSPSGIETILKGMPVAAGSVGLMSGSIPILRTTFQAMLDERPWLVDTDTLELPWREEKLTEVMQRVCGDVASNGKLVFGMMATDGSVHPQPPVSRAFKIVSEALTSCGYELIPWEPPSHRDAVENLFNIFGSDGGKAIRSAIDASGETPVPQLLQFYNEPISESSVGEFWELCRERDRYRFEYAQYWSQAGSRTKSGRPVDGVIMPVAPSTAVRDTEFSYFAYSAIVNVLNYSAGAFPVTFGSRDLDTEHGIGGDKSMNYHVEDVEGMPVGLQVMCRRHEEEKVLGLMTAIEAALQRWQSLGT